MCDDNFPELLDEYLDADDNDNFVKLLKRNKPFVDQIGDGVLLEQCFKVLARDCMAALITGEALGHPVTIKDVPLLWDIAYSFSDHHVFELLITQGEGYKLVDATDPPVLGIALARLSEEAPLCLWSPGQPVFRMLFLLCQSKWRTLLNSARLVAKYSNRVNDTAWMYVKEGDPVALAATLLVAPDKAMLPFPSGLTIKELITKELTATKGDSEKDLKYKLALMDAQKLLLIFQKAGEQLSTLHASMPKYVPVAKVVKDVSTVLVKAGFGFLYDDLNVSGYFSYHASLRHLPHRIQDYAWRLRIAQGYSWHPPCYPPVINLQDAGILLSAPVPAPSMRIERTFSTFQVAGGIRKMPPKAISRSNSRAVATSNCQVSLMSKGMDQAFLSSSLKQLAYVAEKLKKGIKFM